MKPKKRKIKKRGVEPATPPTRPDTPRHAEELRLAPAQPPPTAASEIGREWRRPIRGVTAPTPSRVAMATPGGRASRGMRPDTRRRRFPERRANGRECRVLPFADEPQQQHGGRANQQQRSATRCGSNVNTQTNSMAAAGGRAGGHVDRSTDRPTASQPRVDNDKTPRRARRLQDRSPSHSLPYGAPGKRNRDRATRTDRRTAAAAARIASTPRPATPPVPARGRERASARRIGERRWARGERGQPIRCIAEQPKQSDRRG